MREYVPLFAWGSCLKWPLSGPSYCPTGHPGPSPSMGRHPRASITACWALCWFHRSEVILEWGIHAHVAGQPWDSNLGSLLPAPLHTTLPQQQCEHLGILSLSPPGRNAAAQAWMTRESNAWHLPFRSLGLRQTKYLDNYVIRIIFPSLWHHPLPRTRESYPDWERTEGKGDGSPVGHRGEAFPTTGQVPVTSENLREVLGPRLFARMSEVWMEQYTSRNVSRQRRQAGLRLISPLPNTLELRHQLGLSCNPGKGDGARNGNEVQIGSERSQKLTFPACPHFWHIYY